LVAYRHGLRAAEVCSLEWSQVDFALATLHVRRVKSGKPSTHPIRGDEMRALRKLRREGPKSPFMFVSERGGPFTTDSFNWLVKRAGRKAKLPFQAHAHMLRHAVAMRWQMPVTIPARYRITSGTRISSTRCGTPSWRRRASRTSGANHSWHFAKGARFPAR